MHIMAVSFECCNIEFHRPVVIIIHTKTCVTKLLTFCWSGTFGVAMAWLVCLICFFMLYIWRQKNSFFDNIVAFTDRQFLVPRSSFTQCPTLNLASLTSASLSQVLRGSVLYGLKHQHEMPSFHTHTSSFMQLSVVTWIGGFVVVNSDLYLQGE